MFEKNRFVRFIHEAEEVTNDLLNFVTLGVVLKGGQRLDLLFSFPSSAYY